MKDEYLNAIEDAAENLKKAIDTAMQACIDEISKTNSEIDSKIIDCKEKLAKKKDDNESAIKEQEVFLTAIQKQIQNINEAYKDSILSNNEKGIEAAELKLRQLKKEEFIITQRIDVIKGENDKENKNRMQMISDLCNEYSLYENDLENLTNKASKIEHELIAVENIRKSEKLEEFEHRISWLAHLKNPEFNSAARTIIEIYEENYGEIDVNGHSCGPQIIRAKMNFLTGIIDGIENTVAGEVLKSELKQ